MSAAAGKRNDPHRLGHHEDNPKCDTTGRGKGGLASKRIVVGYGFWIYLLSDIVLFSAFFAAYAVLAHATAGGPGGPQIFTRGRVAIETICLLLSSYCCGLASLGAVRKSQLTTHFCLAATGLLGAAFLAIELSEFTELIARGATPTRSAFLSSFFALVGLHGLHVTIGLLWLGTMMAQIWVKGFRPPIMRRLLCFGLFWHALDIVWVGVFSIVYLLGSRG